MPTTADPVRHQISALQLRRRSLESKLLQPRTMLAASLIERYLGSRAKRRTSPAYYLSRSIQGRTKLSHVRKEELAAIRQQCDSRRDFRQWLTQWRQLTAELDQLWDQLQQAQSVSANEGL